MERRRSVRFEVRLTCRLRIAGESEVLSGMTLNVSCAGALITIADADGNSLPQSGDPVKVELLLPPHRAFGQRCIACDGVAVRVNPDAHAGVLAVQFEHVAFKQAEPESMPAASTAVM